MTDAEKILRLAQELFRMMHSATIKWELMPEAVMDGWLAKSRKILEEIEVIPSKPESREFEPDHRDFAEQTAAWLREQERQDTEIAGYLIKGGDPATNTYAPFPETAIFRLDKPESES